MNPEIRNILARITELEEELIELLQLQQEELKYRIEGTRIRFEQGIAEAHRKLKIGLLYWLAHSEARNVVTAPIIYFLIVPVVFLDISITIYQLSCFPLYRVPRVRRGHYVVIDRYHLSYLNSIEKLNCVYCGYVGGVFAYAREIAARTEQYWCPIKHARMIVDQHGRYLEFADFGDGESYRATIARLRQELQSERRKEAAG